jgi:hypothetical protein
VNAGACSDDGSKVNAFNCSCTAGYQGTFCDLDVSGSGCASSPCSLAGICINVGVDADAFTCNCSDDKRGNYTTGYYTSALCDVFVIPSETYVFTMTFDANVSLGDSVTIEDFVMLLLLESARESDSSYVQEQFAVNVVTDFDGDYVVTVTITSTSEITAKDLGRRVINQLNPSSVILPIQPPPDDDVVQQKKDDDTLLIVVAVSSTVVCVFLAAVLVFRCKQRIKKKYLGNSNNAVSVPV